MVPREIAIFSMATVLTTMHVADIRRTSASGTYECRSFGSEDRLLPSASTTFTVHADGGVPEGNTQPLIEIDLPFNVSDALVRNDGSLVACGYVGGLRSADRTHIDEVTGSLLSLASIDRESGSIVERRIVRNGPAFDMVPRTPFIRAMFLSADERVVTLWLWNAKPPNTASWRRFSIPDLVECGTVPDVDEGPAEFEPTEVEAHPTDGSVVVLWCHPLRREAYVTKYSVDGHIVGTIRLREFFARSPGEHELYLENIQALRERGQTLRACFVPDEPGNIEVWLPDHAIRVSSQDIPGIVWKVNPE